MVRASEAAVKVCKFGWAGAYLVLPAQGRIFIYLFTYFLEWGWGGGAVVVRTTGTTPAGTEGQCLRPVDQLGAPCASL